MQISQSESEKTGDNTRIQLWIKIAISDLKSSQLLYANKHYRTSYFFFQQSVEKANKALFMMSSDLEEKDLKNVGHNQIKVYRRKLVEQEKEVGSTINIISSLPNEIKNHELMGFEVMQKNQSNLQELIKSFDGLHNLDLIYVGAPVLKKMYKQIKDVEAINFKIKKVPDSELKNLLLKMKELADKVNTPEAQELKKDYDGYLSDDKKFKEFSNALKKIWAIYLNNIFIGSTLYMCSLITIQHSSISRYPEDDLNPFEIYNLRLPLAKKQPLFMELLDDVLRRMRKVLKVIEK